MKTYGVGIVGLGSHLPEQRVSNHELSGPLGLPHDWIETKTAILERRRAAPHEATSDLATQAALRALESAHLSAEDIDLIVVGTSTPDYPQPSTACLVQRNLNAHRAFGFDVNAVCSGFVYALEAARALVECNPAVERALVIGAETYSRILDYRDKRTCILFGDGAGAVILAKTPSAQGLAPATLSSDGRKWDHVLVPGGGSRCPATGDTIRDRQHYFKMDGRAVKSYVCEMLPRLLNDAARQAGISVNDFDHIICHQANGHLLEECRQALGIPAHKMHLTVDRYGNTGAASIPVTLDEAYRCGKLLPGDRVAFVTFGGGMTSGSSALTWSLPLLYDAPTISRSLAQNA